MDLSTLKLFVEVMRLGSFTAVARTDGVAPSSVSRSIAGLEKELGVRLFQRNTRNLEPTEAALEYLQRVAPLVGELEAAGQLLAEAGNTPRGTLRVTAPGAFGRKCIVPLLPELYAKYPSLGIELVLTDAYLDLIGERIDLAIRLGELQDSAYVASRLRAMRFHVCASPEYLARRGSPGRPRDICDHECLLFPRAGFNLNWRFRDSAGHIDEVAITGRCLITDSDAIRICALTGMGLALLPDWLVDGDLKSGALVTLLDDYEATATTYHSAVWALHPTREYLPLKVRIFRDYLAGRFGAPPAPAPAG